jgi:tetratricopeptide (TPR) repeat protein
MALVDQLSPHLEAMELEHAIVKFTGDGWLVMSDEQEDAAKLCCLAMVMASNFQAEISSKAGISMENIPSMRLALCWGRDIQVTLRGGQRDFVGNSVRRAVRASQLCQDNEILIDDTVRTWVAHDFIASKVDVDERLEQNRTAKMEEDLTLYVLQSLRNESAQDMDAPVYFVKTLGLLGCEQEADDLVNRISDSLLHRAPHQDPSELLSRWNALLTTQVDYDTARELLNDMRRAGLHPDVRTYNALIEKSQDYRQESRWLQSMQQQGIQPDVTTYNTLLKSAGGETYVERRLQKMEADGIKPDSETLRILVSTAENAEIAARWTERMERQGVKPDAATMETLIQKADSFDTAKFWLERLMSEGYEPSEPAFIAVFAKDVTQIPADDLLSWYLSLPYHPTHPIKRAIAEYRRKGMVVDALRLSLDYPHTDTALKTIRQFPEQALSYFKGVVEADENHPNGAYALGLALMEVGRLSEAVPWLRKAYNLADPGTRKDELSRYLQLLDSLKPVWQAAAAEPVASAPE